MGRGRVTFGSRDLSRAIQRFGDHVESEIKRIIVETAQVILSNAKMLAPVDDGNLRDSIEMEVLNGGLTAVVRVSANYAIWVEFGTGIYSTEGTGRQGGWTYYSDKLGRFVFTMGSRPQPFWFDSIEEGRKYFRKEIRKLG